LTALQQRNDLSLNEKNQVSQALEPILTIVIADTEGIQFVMSTSYFNGGYRQRRGFANGAAIPL
jgi:hypothetical protein